MKTERIQINRNKIYLTIENLTKESVNGIVKIENQFVAFWNKDKPTSLNLGKQIKNLHGEKLVFCHVDQAKYKSIEILKNKIYPLDYLPPLKYTSENICEIMHKELVFEIEPNNEIIKGKIVECFPEPNSGSSPYNVWIKTGNRKKKIGYR